MEQKRDRKYWLSEEPKILETESVTFRLYENAEKLCVSYPDYADAWGRMRMGKTVSCHLCDLRTDEVRTFFRELLEI